MVKFIARAPPDTALRDVLGYRLYRDLEQHGKAVRPCRTAGITCRAHNCRPERQDPPEDLLDLAVEWGLEFSIDTDAHAPGQLEWQPYGCAKAARAGIGADRVVNTRSADDLVAWATAHAE